MPSLVLVATCPLPLTFKLPFLLFLPMTAFLIVLRNAQCTSQLLALVDLGLRQFVHLVGLEILRIWSAASRTCLFSLELLAKSIALVVDLIFINAVWVSAYYPTDLRQ